MTENVTINRTYKDRLFKIIFEDRKELLSLYNALTGKDYQNPNQPLRGFFYFADLYKTKYFSKKIYSTKLVRIGGFYQRFWRKRG